MSMYNAGQIQSYTPQSVKNGATILPNPVKRGDIATIKNEKSDLASFSPLLKNAVLAQSTYKLNEPYLINALSSTRVPDYKNNLKSRLTSNKANIMAVIIRTMGAVDSDGNGLIQNGEISGNFINAVDRLDELKSLGINTLHVLPINPPGTIKAKGTAGSLYAPKDLLSIDPMLKDPNDSRTVEEQCKYFIDECHKRGISVMIDLPSCASVDMAQAHPNLILKDKSGLDKTPQGWEDIRMFRYFDNEEKRTLNKDLVDLHKKYIDFVTELGFDGIRSDVARAKPVEFWDILIPYSHQKDPEFGWLAETYTYEDASPQLNMPQDRPYDQLNVGFDAYYGQYHLFPQWQKNSDLHNYVLDNIDLSNSFDVPKALIGSIHTHDDTSLMLKGGAPFVKMTMVLQNTLPQMNPYFVDGVQSGDYYTYPYAHAINSETRTGSFKLDVHDGLIDIFNLSRRPGGNNPDIGAFMKSCSKTLKEGEYKDIINKGSYIPLRADEPKIFAFARHLNGRTILVIANKDVNFRTCGKIDVPTIKNDEKFNNLVPSYSDKSRFQIDNLSLLSVDLAPASAYVFEINTPEIEKNYKGKIGKQIF